jgi:hypothetical protein
MYKKNLLQWEIDEIIMLYATHDFTLASIGKLFNLSNPTIVKTLKDNNITIHPRGHYSLLKLQNEGTIETPTLYDIRRGTDIRLNDSTFYQYVECPTCKEKRWVNCSHVRRGELICKNCSNNPLLNNKGTFESPVEGDVCRGSTIGRKGKFYKWAICPDCGKGRWLIRPLALRNPPCPICAGLKRRGEKCHLWRGGSSWQQYPTDFNNRLKEQIRKRDNYTCQLCGKPQNGTKLAIHHIDYIKKNIDPTNLISLCPLQIGDCHAKTNSHNRAYWTEYFTKILKDRGIIKDTIEIHHA